MQYMYIYIYIYVEIYLSIYIYIYTYIYIYYKHVLHTCAISGAWAAASLTTSAPERRNVASENHVSLCDSIR